MLELLKRSSANPWLLLLEILLGIVVLVLSAAEIAGIDGLLMIVLMLVGFWVAVDGTKRIVLAVWSKSLDAPLGLSLLWMAGLLIAVMFSDFLPLGEHMDTAATIDDKALLPVDIFSAHPLGTNGYALDTLSQVIHGAKVSLLIALFAVVVSLVVGGVIGTVAGYFRGWTDTFTGIGADALISIPPLILLIALASVFGTPDGVGEAILKTGIALAVVTTPAVIRLARANALSISKRDFVLATKALGAKPTSIIFKEVLPSVAIPVFNYAFLLVAMLIIAEGSLSFLGLGLQPPQPTWGNMIAEANVTTLRTDPHLALVPGICMFLTVYALNIMGERAQTRWDPREAKV